MVVVPADAEVSEASGVVHCDFAGGVATASADPPILFVGGEGCRGLGVAS